MEKMRVDSIDRLVLWPASLSMLLNVPAIERSKLFYVGSSEEHDDSCLE